MTELLRPSGPMGEPYPPCSMMDRCRISVVYPGNGELRHSKSDDLILQSNSPEPTEPPAADPRAQIWATLDRPTSSAATRASAVDSTPCYYSDSETDEAQAEKSAKKELSCDLQRLAAATAAAAARQQRRGLYDRVDPEDSIRDLVTENDFYRFVLFKRHYDKYIHLSAKYEEARNIAYYLEEKYHEVKAERDELVGSKQQLERRLEAKHVELHDKEEELFLQLELVVRLDDDRDKLREEMERVRERADELQKQLSQAQKELDEHAEQAKQARRRLERARLEALGHVAAERKRRDALEQDNERLRAELTTSGRQQQIAELKWLAHQSASLTSQLHKGVRHLASCTRKKCSVCSYTRHTFGEMAGSTSSGHRRRKATSALTTGCLGWMRPSGTHSTYYRDTSPRPQSPIRENLPPPPPPPAQLTSVPSHSSLGALSLAYVAYIDEDVDTEDGDTASSAASSGAPRAFSSDSGFSSELYDSRCQGSTGTGGAASSSSSGGGSGVGETSSSTTGLHRSRWSSSFRRLIHRVSKRSSP